VKVWMKVNVKNCVVTLLFLLPFSFCWRFPSPFSLFPVSQRSAHYSGKVGKADKVLAGKRPVPLNFLSPPPFSEILSFLLIWRLFVPEK